MIEKRQIGFEPFDTRFGGCYAGRGMLLQGRSGSGKTTACLRFLLAGLPDGECGLLLSTRPAREVLAHASGLGLPVRGPLEDGRLLVVEYRDRAVPGEVPGDPMIPPEGFRQLGEIIETHKVRRAAIDTALPWLLPPETGGMNERIVSLVRAFERLDVTAMFAMPRPATESTRGILAHFERAIPVAAALEYDPGKGHRELRVSKFLGRPDSPAAFPYRIGQPAGEAGPPARNPRRPPGGFAEVMKDRSVFLGAGR